MIRVRFTAACSIYNSGETAGFDDDTAAALVKQGVAVLAPAPEPDAPPTKGKKAAAADA